MRIVHPSVLVAAVLAVPMQSHAVDRTWIGIGGAGFYDVASNWSPSGVPVAADNVLFTFNDRSTRWDNLVGNRTITNVTVSSTGHTLNSVTGIHTFTITGTTTLSAGSSRLSVGDGLHSASNYLNVVAAGTVALNAGSTLDVNNFSNFTYAGAMTVGGTSSGQSFLNVINGRLTGQTGSTLTLRSESIMEVQGANGGTTLASANISSATATYRFQTTSTIDSLNLGTGTTGLGSLNLESGATLGLNFAAIGGSTAAAGVTTGRLTTSGTLDAANVLLNPSGSLVINSGITTINSVSLRGHLRVAGGELRLGGISSSSTESLDFLNGTVRLTSGFYSYGATGPFAAVIGDDNTLSTGQRLIIDGTASLSRMLILDGGNFETQQLFGGSNLILRAGRLNLTTNALTIGSAGQLPANLDLPAGVSVGSDQNVLVASDASVVVRDGALLRAGAEIQNAGTITLDGINARLSAANVINTGRLDGAGRIDASLNNSGVIQVFHDRQLRFTSAVTNQSAGRIQGRGALQFDAGLSNAGRLEFSGGFTDITGNVTNASTGRVLTSGGGTTTFYGAVSHQGAEIRTAANSNTVFFGPVSGPGAFTGTGTVYFENTYSPGSSPGLVTFAGDLNLSDAAELIIELAGAEPGTQYDRLSVAGSASVDGLLDVRFLGGFVPARSNTFDILLAGSLTGSFDNPLRFGRLVPDGQRGGFRLRYDDNTVTLDNWLLTGDINGDGAVNNLDIAPFVALLTGGSINLDASFAGDVNADGAVNNLDIAPFVALLTGGRPIPDNDPSFAPLIGLVPEPASLALLALATLPLSRRRRRD